MFSLPEGIWAGFFAGGKENDKDVIGVAVVCSNACREGLSK
jgi:hypothetical protein